MAAEDPAFEEVAGLIRESDSILFITGAGISTDSGLPTYRGIGGLYENKVTDHGIPIEQALSATMMAREPAITWRYLWEIAEATRGARPNRSHEIIGQWVAEKPGSWVLTQNVDGLHEKAGIKRVLEYHGSVTKLRCISCNTRFGRDTFDLLLLLRENRLPPRCPECNGVVKSDTVSFGEPIPSDVARQSLEEAQKCDLMLICGTSAVVFPFASLPKVARQRKAVTIIEVNAEPTPLTYERISDYLITGKTGEILPGIVEAVKRMRE